MMPAKLTTSVLISTLRADGVSLSASNGKLKINAPLGVLSSEDKKLLRAHKADIIRQLSQNAEKPEYTQPKQITLQPRINRFIERGIFFHVEADTFTIAGHIRRAAKEDIDFLTTNAVGVLCHLQQMLLCRDIFDHEPSLLEDFRTEIFEKGNIAAESLEDVSVEIHEAAVIETTKSWFADIYGGNQ